MTGSQAPQRALQRLSRLGSRTDRLGVAAVPAALLDDPLAGLTARPLDGRVLESVLERLEGGAETTGATASSSAAARFRRGSVGRGRAHRASNVLPSRPGTGRLPPAAAHEPIATRSPSRARRIRPEVPTGHEPNGSSPTVAPAAVADRRESSPLARAAGRVPGGVAAVATRVAAEWTSNDLAGAVENGSVLLQAALARAVAQPVDAGEPSHGRVRSDPAGSLTSPPSLEDALAPRAQGEPARQPFARLGGEQPTGVAGAAEHGEPESAPQLPGSSSSGLAELVRRWESAHGRDDEPQAVRLEREADAGGGIEAEEALARALERVLAAELRRGGIEVDAG